MLHDGCFPLPTMAFKHHRDWCPLRATKNRACRRLQTTLFLFALAAGATLFPASAPSQIVPDSPTTQWVPVLYANSFPDAPADQQTGSSESDLVGNASQPSLFMKYNNG